MPDIIPATGRPPTAATSRVPAAAGAPSPFLDAAAVRRWCVAGLAGLRRHQREIDDLNVYPVPDGDTGTNLALTMSAAVEATTDAVGPAGGGAADLLRRVARSALLGARGNSGIILSQLLTGMAESLAESLAEAAPVEQRAEQRAELLAEAGSATQAGARAESLAETGAEFPAETRAETPTEVPARPDPDGRALAGALDRGARAAWRAVAMPVDGTILSVGAAAGHAAVEAVRGGETDAGRVARVAMEAARAALARTPQQLPALARAGVVDAGGRGLVVLLEALVEALTGEPVPAEPVARVAPGPRRLPLTVAREAGSPEYGYEVQYLLDTADGTVLDVLRRTLADLGDSLVVVGSAPTWHIHVHVNDVGAAIEAGVEAGRPYRITVTRFADQPGVGDGGRPSTAPPGPVWAEDLDDPDEPHRRAVVVVCSGDGLVELFTGEGAAVVRGTPSTAEVLAAIRATGVGRVVVMPNDPNVTAVAGAAAAEARAGGIRVGVVPTRSPVQALAALAVRDPGRRFTDDVIAMAEAAGACRYAEVTIAGREALTVAGRCQPGDVLALVEGEVNLIGRDLHRTCRLLVDRLLTGGGELVTLVTGADAPHGLGDSVRAHLSAEWPFVEVQCFDGGQPHYPLLVGVE